MATEERRVEVEPKEIVYKTKIVQFLGRSTPIVLQNDNGPCPLLAICNVLLLRNNLNLSLDVAEVSQQKLLSLVAERLIDSNCNVQDKDDGYVNNQQQNISDAIDLLPRLATGIDVNVHFKKINDFEFTRECAIFDLLDIGIYHGWIVDPQDTNTVAAIGSKSYNTLVAELVAFEARKSNREDRSVEEEDYVDFAAATTATLGVPSPTLSRGRSFDDRPSPIPIEQRRRKGDIQEEEELSRALNLSSTEILDPASVSLSPISDWSNACTVSERSKHIQGSGSGTDGDIFGVQIASESRQIFPSDLHRAQECDASNDLKDNTLVHHDLQLPKIVSENHMTDTGSGDPGICERPGNSVETDLVMSQEAPNEGATDRVGSYKDLMIASGDSESTMQTCTEDLSTFQIQESNGSLFDLKSSFDSGFAAPYKDLHSSNGREDILNDSEVVPSNLDGNEPIYEGEECIIDSGISVYENREPVYEGEVVLAKQAETMKENCHSATVKDEVTWGQWQLIKNFLEHNASQLTIYGLFCLQEGLKERELCIFFRNNHFSTMFKFKGDLYLLATDQGYINQPDLVWEKLNEVNGDTVFMTGNFMEFKADNQVNQSWDQQSAMTSTADYLAALECSAPSSSDLNSDLQLAIALQQQEFDQQPQRQQSPRQHQQHSQQSSVTGRSRLITGPQGTRSSTASQKSESKMKEKCIVM